jgi:pilus assembly protein CpaB
MRGISYRTRNFFIAGVLGVLAVALTFAYAESISSNNDKSSGSSSGPVTVLVASKDIPLGTAGASLAGAGWVKPVQVTRDQAAANAVRSVAQLKSEVAIQPTYKGEQIVAQRFGTTQQVGLLAQMHGTLRVVELAGDTHQVLAGMLKVGNRVDVVGSVRNPESGSSHFTAIAVRNLLVVGAPQKTTASGVTSQSASVDLLLTTNQAERLFWLQKNGDWSLLLRPSTKAKDAQLPPISSQTVLESR